MREAGVEANPDPAAAPRRVALADEILPAIRDDEEVGSAVRAAVAAERARIARELRECLSVGLLGVVVDAAAALSLQPLAVPHPLRQRLGEFAQRTRDAVTRVQQAIDDVREDTLGDALTAIATAWGAAAGVNVSLDVSPGVPATEAVRAEFTEILREALQNVARHARASRVRVCLRTEGERLTLSVADNGVSFLPPADLRHHPGRGLARIAERAGLLGGSLAVRSWPGWGTCLVVQARVPALGQGARSALPVPTLGIAIENRDPVVRSGLRAVLEQVPGFEIVAEVSDAAELAEQVRLHQPDLLLADVRTPRNAGAEAVPSAMREKPFPPSGDAPGGTSQRHDEGSPAWPHPGPDLTPREREILGLIAEGLSNRQIAARLVISPKTVKNHIWNLYQRIGVHERGQAVSRWRELCQAGRFIV